MATETEAKPAKAKVSAEAQELNAKVEAWFVKHFHGNRISQDEQNYNICHAAKEDLKTILA